jgi:hypothetical protein
MKTRTSWVAQASLPVIVMIILTGCAGTARIGNVWSSKRTDTMSDADRDLFLSDRASRLRFQAKSLPADEQREEFLVTWRGAGARVVKFEYRQANVPDTVVMLTAPAIGQRRYLFEVRGDDYRNGGPVTAWRASLWDGDRVLDERKSALW